MEEKILEAMTLEDNEELTKKQRSEEKTISKSFRAMPETHKRFSNIVNNKNYGETVTDVVEAMCDLFDRSNFKKLHVSRTKEIEQMEHYLSAMRTLFDNSVNMLDDAEERIRKDYAKQLDSLTEALAKQQTKNKELEKTASEAVKAGQQAQKEAAMEIERNKNELKMLKMQHDKDIVSMYANKANEEKAAAEAAKQIAEIKAEADKKIADARVEAEKRCVLLEKEISKLEGKIEAMQEQNNKYKATDSEK